MEYITSRSNELIASTAKLKEKKHRENEKAFIFEGIKLTKEAISSGIEITHIFVTDSFEKKHPEFTNEIKYIKVSQGVCEKLSENLSPEGIICRAKYPTHLHKIYTPEQKNGLDTPLLIMSSLQDPGNLGTIIRTSASFGKKKIVLSSDCADIYNQKTVRASMGALFRTEIFISQNLAETIKDIKSNGLKVYATALDCNAISLRDADITNACFVLGNEGHGLSNEVIDACTSSLIIPMEQDAESLNVSSAASVLLWEMYR